MPWFPQRLSLLPSFLQNYCWILLDFGFMVILRTVSTPLNLICSASPACAFWQGGGRWEFRMRNDFEWILNVSLLSIGTPTTLDFGGFVAFVALAWSQVWRRFLASANTTTQAQSETQRVFQHVSQHSSIIFEWLQRLRCSKQDTTVLFRSVLSARQRRQRQLGWHPRPQWKPWRQVPVAQLEPQWVTICAPELRGLWVARLQYNSIF